MQLHIFGCCVQFIQTPKSSRVRQVKEIFIIVFLTAISITARTQNTTTVFYDATVVDVQSGKLLKHQEVVVSGSKIIAVRNKSKQILPEAARIINAKGK